MMLDKAERALIAYADLSRNDLQVVLRWLHYGQRADMLNGSAHVPDGYEPRGVYVCGWVDCLAAIIEEEPCG